MWFGAACRYYSMSYCQWGICTISRLWWIKGDSLLPMIFILSLISPLSPPLSFHISLSPPSPSPSLSLSFSLNRGRGGAWPHIEACSHTPLQTARHNIWFWNSVTRCHLTTIATFCLRWKNILAWVKSYEVKRCFRQNWCNFTNVLTCMLHQ